jgi:hypothetical protein
MLTVFFINIVDSKLDILDVESNLICIHEGWSEESHEGRGLAG